MDEMFANTGIASQLFGKQYREEDMRGKGDNFSNLQKGLDRVSESQSNLDVNVNKALDEVLRQQNLEGAFNTRNQIDPNNQFDVAELTKKQKDFMRNPMQSLDFQSRDSLYNKVKQLEDKGFLGFGAQEPTTREEFEQFIKSGLV